MGYAFHPQQGAIEVAAELEGPTGSIRLRLYLDTGATESLIVPKMLMAVGHDPSQAVLHRQVTTASAVETWPIVFTARLKALGQERTGFQVLAHALPSGTNADGLLGLDFLRGLTLTIDFRKGEIELV